jgi:predicted nucleotidyltransferase
MTAEEALRIPDLKKMIEDLEKAVGTGLRSVMLYGSAARGEFREGRSDLNLIVVLQDLEPHTLEALTSSVARWVGRGHHAPRLFTPAQITESADVFPIEFLDISDGRIVLHGKDLFAGIEIGVRQLRLQCERELREKMMRLREAYIECHARPKDLARLLATSYSSFVALFRGCLRLLGGTPPAGSAQVVEAFCRQAGLDAVPFEEVARFRHGQGAGSDPKPIFIRYYEQLTTAIRAVDRFQQSEGGEGR